MLPACSLRASRSPSTPGASRSFDGTEIAYHSPATAAARPRRGPRPPARPWIVLADGIGGGLPVWRAQIDYLRDRYRFLTWDYRGLYASERPRPDAPAPTPSPSHVRDLEAVLAAERVDRAGFVGWSLGVQVVLEALRSRLRDRVRGLVLVNGTWGRPLDSLIPLPGAARRPARRSSSSGARSRHRPLVPPAHRPARRGRLVEAPRPRRPRRRPGHRRRAGAALGQLDLDAFLRNLRAFGAHDAEGVLAAASVPALVVAGDSDPFVPLGVAQQMARRIPDAELLVVRGGAHCAPVEYPELVGLRMERFWRDTAL